MPQKKKPAKKSTKAALKDLAPKGNPKGGSIMSTSEGLSSQRSIGRYDK